MKKNVTYLFLLLASSAFAQQAVVNSKLEIKSLNKHNQLPSFISFSGSNVLPPSIEGMNEWFRLNLGANADFNLVNTGSSVDFSGMSHTRFKQTYRNIPVEGSMVNTHFKNGVMNSLNGNYYPNLNIDIKPMVQETDALKIALARYGFAVFAWQNKKEENLLKQIQQNPLATYYPKAEIVIISKNHSQVEADFRLAYKFNVYVSEPLSREWIYIDAINGDILFTEQIIHTTDVKGTAITKYSGMQNITCDSTQPDSFFLKEQGRGLGIETYSARGGTRLDTGIILNSDTKAWNLTNIQQDEVALDIHWGLEKTYDFYKEKLNRNSLNDSGFKLIGLVHFGTKFNNAFWNGQYTNFGDGDGVKFKPLTSIDVCGHEVSHGLTQKTASLIYMNESGALNESFSDIFGKCVEHYAIPDSFNWLIGNRFQANGNYFRSMENPKLKANPKFYDGLFFLNASSPGPDNDYGGVHINSGVQNYWFYLMIEGGTGNREKPDQNPYWVKGIGWDKATQLVYTTLTQYLTPFSDYSDVSTTSMLVADNLFGVGSEESKTVQMGWYAVGLADLPTVGLQKIALNSTVTLAPNPANEKIALSFKNNNNTVRNIEICDIMGQLILQQKVSSGNSIDIANWAKGFYLMRFEDGSCLKFVKY